MRFLTRINGSERLIWAFRPIVSVSTDKNLSLSDAGTYQHCTNAAAITISIPPDVFGSAPEMEIDIARNGAGVVNIACGSGVTINGVSTTRSISAQYQAVFLKRISANTFVLHGAYT